ncbi:YheT family hydrolase [Nitritalea halalkaliphila]|uniref:YheT family hydrolase n=1 Tax=Nitritalea halalkaliphila TaxID=590849 RepID=UPI0029352C07|nr:alpha/beta fold hydrolase [Nitritalea halalkaliphila]
MPILSSAYSKPPFYLFHPHLETIVPSIWRQVPEIHYRRERIDTPDGDFLDLDWAELLGSPACVVISHGLEGSTERHYVKGLVKAFHLQGISALAWNNRSCGEEMNRGPLLYHHGASYDLETVVMHLLQARKYEKIYLVGVSMGGAQTLKYLGEKGTQLPSKIKAAAVHSTPCNLADSAATLHRKANTVYKNKFLGKLKKKVRLKAEQFPELIDLGPWRA